MGTAAYPAEANIRLLQHSPSSRPPPSSKLAVCIENTHDAGTSRMRPSTDGVHFIAC